MLQSNYFVQVGTDGDIPIVIDLQNVISGETRQIKIPASEVVKPLSSAKDFGFNFKGKSLRVVTIPVRHHLWNSFFCKMHNPYSEHASGKVYFSRNNAANINAWHQYVDTLQ